MSEFICEELIIEIFTRLPIEVILRFRSLCKSIRSCIDSPHFIRKHTLLSPQKFLIIHEISSEIGYTLHSEDQLPLYPKHGYIDATALKFPFDFNSEIVGSCNGIICLYLRSEGISLWNPSIRRKLTMPDRPCSMSKSQWPYINFGFGFDPITCDYKILRISYSPYSLEKNSFIYSAKKDAWCRIDSPTTPFSHVISQARFLNGALHWVVHDSFDKWPGSVRYIMTFDFSTHVFGSIELPSPDCEIKLLTIINDSLAIVSTDGDTSRIWVRRVGNRTASWNVEYELKINLQGAEKFVGLTDNGNFLFITSDQKCVAYNHESGRQKPLKKYGFKSRDIEMCVESLELLNTALPYEEECMIPIHENDDFEIYVKSLDLLDI